MKAAIFWVLMACTILSASPVFAQSQGRVISDGAVIWRSDVSVVAATASVGTTLDLTARSDRWYEVIIPEALGGRGERGLIAVSQVQLLPGAPEPPFRQLRDGGPTEQTRPAPPPAEAQRVGAIPAGGSARSFRGFISVNGGYQVTSNDFGENVTFRENAEDGHFETDYVVRAGPAFDVAGGGMLWRRLGVGVGLSRFSRAIPTTLNGSVPHPFFFNRPRSVGGEIAGVKREELAVHVQARAFVPVTTALQVTVFGGPSFFQVKQGVVTDFTYSESYPYDEATFGTAQTTSARASKIGFNAGADVAFFLTRHVGVGVTVQFAGTTIDLASASGGTQEVRAGGGSAGGGLRLRF